MSRRRHRDLTEDERIVWSTVARSITPLPGKSVPDAPPAEPLVQAPPPAAPARAEPPRPFLPPYIPPVSQAGPRQRGRTLDRAGRERLAKGKTPIEARIDLHGMIQSQAHALLLRFLSSARMQGLRHVLVITGKGSARGSDGVLRRVVPEWLATAPFSDFVSGQASAERQHGGEGALYVRLRKLDRDDDG